MFYLTYMITAITVVLGCKFCPTNKWSCFLGGLKVRFHNILIQSLLWQVYNRLICVVCIVGAFLL